MSALSTEFTQSIRLLLTSLYPTPKVGLPSTLVQIIYPSVVQKMCTSGEPTHISVLLKESLEILNLKPGMVAVDCTLGLGGHASEILKAIGPKGFLYAFERDERNKRVAEKRLEKVGKNFHIFLDSFASLKDRLQGKGVASVDAILFDLGLSSPHIDEADRGFSFQKEGPLDMRFDARGGRTAEDLLNHSSEQELSRIFWEYGEERGARRLAHAVVKRRKAQPFHSTTEFTSFIEENLGRGPKGKHRAAPIFQALRMAVNEELMALELGLSQAIELLAPQGRVVVLSYHSLEDRLVKKTFRNLATDLRDPIDPFGVRVLRSKSLSLLTKKPINPSEEEIAQNPRARSAHLRAAEKL